MSDQIWIVIVTILAFGNLIHFLMGLSKLASEVREAVRETERKLSRLSRLIEALEGEGAERINKQ